MARPGLSCVLAAALFGAVAGAGASATSSGASARGGHSAAATPAVQHPTPGLVPVVLNYTPPLTFDGTTVFVPPLEHAVVPAALEDFGHLRYLQRTDLGGFEPAPVGHFLSATTGRAITAAPKQAQVPLLTQIGKKVTVFGYHPGTTIPSTSAPPGRTTVPPTRRTTPTTPVTPPPRTKSTTPGTGFLTPPVTTHHGPPPTTAPPTTTPTTPPTTTPPASTTTTIVPPTTTTTTPHQRPPSTPPPTQYIQLTETDGHLPVIDVTNMEPGKSASETLTLENIGTEPFALSMKSVDTTSNTLSTELRLMVTGTGSAAGQVYYDGTLSSSDTGVQITHLAPGATVLLQVSLVLPTSAGNGVQRETAKVDLYWDAT